MKPEYRVKMEIYDDSNAEVVAFIDEPLFADDTEHTAQIYRLLEKFKKNKDEHEATYYPKEQE